MNESNNPINIDGNWNITVDTPFGKQKYSSSIDSLNGNLTVSISHEKGIAILTNASFVDGMFSGLLEVEFPIKATVTLQASIIDNNKMFGTLLIDEYLETMFVGVR
jgi:hypothetical protein